MAGLIFGMLFAGTAVRAQLTNLIDWDHTWWYDVSGTNLGTAWRATSYDHSAWFSGQGSFGSESEALPPGVGFVFTPLSTENNGQFTTNFYFRTEFTFTGGTNNVILVLSAAIDDGAVFYLNGGEIRPRIRMPATAITHLTFATEQSDIVGGYGVDEIAFAPTNLINGRNVLAAEVHQGGNGSSDIIFAAKLQFGRGTRPVFTRQPTNQTIFCAGAPVTFSAPATGFNVQYLWYSNNNTIAVSGANDAEFTITPTRVNMNGQFFFVIASNVLGTVRSTNVMLTVYPDECGPRLETAESRDHIGRTNELLVTFDEAPFFRSVTNVQNYSIVALNDSNEVVEVIQAANQGLTIRMILSTNLYRTNNYVLTVNDVTDSIGNAIAPNSQIRIFFRTNIFTMESDWRFNHHESDNSLGSAWVENNFNDDPFTPPFHWSDGVGIFWNDQINTTTPCAPRGNTPNLQVNTVYFRKQFTLPTNYTNQNVIAELTYIVDDGAIFYLNGREIYRTINMPRGDVTFATDANSCGEAVCLPVNVAIPDGLLRRGIGPTATNVLAVEVHQCPADGNDPDVVFGCSLSLPTPPTFNLPTEPRPRLNIARMPPNMVKASWTNGHGFALERANPILTNIWREVQPMMNTNMSIIISNPAQFYRLRKVN